MKICVECAESDMLCCGVCDKTKDICLNCVAYGEGSLCMNCVEEDEGVDLSEDIRTLLEWIEENARNYYMGYEVD